MVIKHYSYYSMTDVQVEVMFRIENIPQSYLVSCWFGFFCLFFGLFFGFVGFFKYFVRFALQFKCQVYLADHDTQVSEFKKLRKYLTVLTEGSDKISRVGGWLMFFRGFLTLFFKKKINWNL